MKRSAVRHPGRNCTLLLHGGSLSSVDVTAGPRSEVAAVAPVLMEVTVPEVMATAGLTHGGFYKHFESKDALVAQACTAGFTQRLAAMDDALETTDDAEAARRAWLQLYLSPAHRDAPQDGCAGAALAGDVARAPAEAPLREAYLDGLRSMIEKMGRLGNRPADPEAREQEVLVELATAVGAVVLSRAVTGDDLSERVLAAVRRHLIDE